MKTVTVKLGRRSYQVVTGARILPRLGGILKGLAIGSDAFVITNRLLKRRYGGALAQTMRQAGLGAHFRIIADTEKSKSMECATRVLKDLACFDRQKKVFIAAFGGGVAGDLSGFVASVYKRGIPYVQLPTTLLAQIDSAIGGKTAVDLTQAKNLVGAFYQPRLVLSDITLLKTLPPRQIRSGLAEAIKYAVIRDPALFAFLEKNYKAILALKEKPLEHLVWRCSSIKAAIVSSDEREEKGIRTILNFGHTAGHALEAASGYGRYSHGEAVALGMLVATDISRELGLLPDKEASRIEGLIKATGLPTRIQSLPVAKVIRSYYRDKKFSGARNRLVLVRRIGKTEIVQGVPLETVRRAILKRMGRG